MLCIQLQLPQSTLHYQFPFHSLLGCPNDRAAMVQLPVAPVSSTFQHGQFPPPPTPPFPHPSQTPCEPTPSRHGPFANEQPQAPSTPHRPLHLPASDPVSKPPAPPATAPT